MNPSLNLPNAPWDNQMANDIEQGHDLYDDNLIDKSEQGMLLVHLNNDELAGLIALQGEEIRDEETGYYTFPILGERAEDPEFVKTFMDLFKDLKDASNTEDLYQESIQELPQPEFSEKEMETEAELNLSSMGENGDDRMCFLPENFTALLIELNNGEPEINSQTGLLSFFFKALGRVVGNALPIVGSILGGPIGGTLGKLGGQLLKGKSFNKALRSAGEYGLNSALVHGANHLMGGKLLNPLGAAQGNMFNQAGLNPFSGNTGIMQSLANFSHHANPGLGSLPLMGMNAFSGGLPGMQGGMGGLGNMLGMGGQGTNMQAAGNLPSMPASMAGKIMPGAQNIAQAVSQSNLGNVGANLQSGASGLPSLQSNNSLIPSMLATAAKHAMLMAGHKEDKKLHNFQNSQQAYKRKQHEDDKAFFNTQLNLLNSPLQAAIDQLREKEEEDERKRGKKKNKYAEGGMIKGKGKGQDDKIATTIPANSYIIDALSVAHLGDGSSEAGGKVLDKFVKDINSQVPKHHLKTLKKQVSKESPPTDVLLSNDEYRIDPLTVKIIGNNNSQMGAKLLDRMRENLRTEKSLAGGGIPGKAKDPMFYMR